MTIVSIPCKTPYSSQAVRTATFQQLIVLLTNDDTDSWSTIRSALETIQHSPESDKVRSLINRLTALGLPKPTVSDEEVERRQDEIDACIRLVREILQ